MSWLQKFEFAQKHPFNSAGVSGRNVALAFRCQEISFGMARKMASMDVFQFQDLLDERGIPIHYDVDEYLTDLKNLQILK